MESLSRLIPPARWRNICVALLLITIVLVVSSSALDNQMFEYAALVTLGLAIGGTMGLWRCPRCRRMLPLSDMTHRQRCPKCNADIQNYNGH